MLSPFETIITTDAQGTRLVNRGTDDAKLLHDTLAAVQRGPDAAFGNVNNANTGPVTPGPSPRGPVSGPSSTPYTPPNTRGTSGGGIRKSPVTRSMLARKQQQFGYWIV